MILTLSPILKLTITAPPKVFNALYHRAKSLINWRTRLPKFYDWGGGSVPIQWSYGWQTGKNDDLICVKPRVKGES